MYEEYMLIKEIRGCQNKDELKNIRKKVANFFENCKSIESMRRVQCEFKEAKNRVKKNRNY